MLNDLLASVLISEIQALLGATLKIFRLLSVFDYSHNSVRRDSTTPPSRVQAYILHFL